MPFTREELDALDIALAVKTLSYTSVKGRKAAVAWVASFNPPLAEIMQKEVDRLGSKRARPMPVEKNR